MCCWAGAVLLLAAAALGCTAAAGAAGGSSVCCWAVAVPVVAAAAAVATVMPRCSSKALWAAARGFSCGWGAASGEPGPCTGLVAAAYTTGVATQFRQLPPEVVHFV